MKLLEILKSLGKFLAALLFIVLVYLLFAFVFSRISYPEEPNAPDDLSIYIKTNGVHTDIVVPVTTSQRDWSTDIRFEDIVSKDSTYSWVGVGWGDKGFYLETPTWAELQPSVAFRAGTGLGSTAIHATFYHTIKVDSSCRQIDISHEQYDRLIEYIDNSVDLDQTGHWINIETDANYGDSDAFYEAKGSYSIFHTCNTWVNDGLKYCGQRYCLWTPFDTGLFLNYKDD